MVIGTKQRLGLWSVAAASVLVACAAEDRPLTQLILVADTDVSNVDTIQFEITGPGGIDKEVAQAAHNATSGPAYVSLVRDDGVLGPLTVVARGLRGNNSLIERTHRVSFVPKQTRVVSLHLFASCLRPPRCTAEQACDATGCISQDVTEAQLSSWTGTPPRLNGTMVPSDAGGSDAGVSDAGNPVLRECGAAGSVDLQSNVAHCGACDRACMAGPHATSAACVSGACSYACSATFAACDTVPTNGCETDTLTSNEHCGKCDSKCTGGRMCTAGTCVRP